MPILIDDKDVPLQGSSIRALLASAREHLLPSGRVVVEVKLDGEPVFGDELDSDAPTDLDSSEVRLYSAKPEELSIGVLEQVRAQLVEATQMQEEAADLLQKDEPAKALELVGQSVTGWLSTQQAVASTAQLLQIDLAAVAVDGDRITDRMQELIERLTELKQLIAANDLVALADTLAYEWPDTTQRWDSAIGAMIKHIEVASS